MLNFPYKQFVKAKNDNNSIATNETARKQIIQKGEEIQKFYEELIKEPSEKNKVKSEIKIKQEKDIKKEKWVKVKIEPNTRIKKEKDVKIEVKKENIKHEEVLISDSDDDLR